MKKVSIGFVIAPGFRPTDVVLPDAVLGPLPRHQVYYVAENLGFVYGKAGFPIKPNATFETCPHLDVLVVGELPDAKLSNEGLIQFIQSRAETARYVVGVSNGVIALGIAGVLKGRKATADRANVNRLGDFGVTPVDCNHPVVDGKFYTSGPSTGAIESAFMVMRELHGDRISRYLELNLEYNPQQQYPAPAAGERANIASLKDATPMKVAVLTPPSLYVPDVVGAIDVFGSIPGTEVFYVWKQKGLATGMAGPQLHSTTTFDECPQVDVIIVGAVRPEVSSDREVAEFLRQQAGEARAVIGTCAGVLVLGAAGLLEGKKAVTNFHMAHLLPSLGALTSEKEVEVDGKLYTAGPAVGAYEAAIMAANDIYGDEIARHLEQHVLEYHPHPVFGVGSPKLAGKLLTAISRTIAAPLTSFYRAKAKRGYWNYRRQSNSRLAYPHQ